MTSTRYYFQALERDGCNVIVVMIQDTEKMLVTYLAVTGADAEYMHEWWEASTQEEKDSLDWQKPVTVE